MRPGSRALFCRQTCSVRFMESSAACGVASGCHAASGLLVTSRFGMHVLKRQRLGVPRRRLSGPLVLPDGDVLEVFVVALRLAVGRLELLAEVGPARLAPLQRVQAEKFGE